jgi:pilus assembly protein CpaE
MLRRLRGDAGQATIEFVGSLSVILFTALAIWQLLIVMWAYNETSNAARTAARVESRGGDTRKAARNALPGPLRDDLHVDIDGETATLQVRIPLFFPGLNKDSIRAVRKATIPK